MRCGGRRLAGSRDEAAVSRSREAITMAQTTRSVAHQTEEPGYADADLVAQLRAGDEATMSQLVDEWSPAMLRVARSFVESAQSAEDVVQDAWRGMLIRPARFEGRA